MKIGIWYEFMKEEKKAIRKVLRKTGANTGQATPVELVEWTKNVIRKALDSIKLEQGGGNK